MDTQAVMIAAFAGWLIVSRAPAILHSPLISSCLFLHGIVVVAGLHILLNATTPAEQVAGFLAVLFGAANAAGGYAVSAGSLTKFRLAAASEAAAALAAAEPGRDRRRNSAPRRRAKPKRPAKD
jgi:NAD(P) transhydrogenase subunit alpha